MKIKQKHITIPMFQFHKGAINTDFDKAVNYSSFCFNSIKVRLIHIGKMPTKQASRSFNSIKVRLIQTLGALQSMLNRFQFHKGAINTCTTDYI